MLFSYSIDITLTDIPLPLPPPILLLRFDWLLLYVSNSLIYAILATAPIPFLPCQYFIIYFIQRFNQKSNYCLNCMPPIFPL